MIVAWMITTPKEHIRCALLARAGSGRATQHANKLNHRLQSFSLSSTSGNMSDKFLTVTQEYLCRDLILRNISCILRECSVWYDLAVSVCLVCVCACAGAFCVCVGVLRVCVSACV